MDSSTSKPLVDEAEAERLKAQRVTLRRASVLLGVTYQTIRRHVKNRHLITFPIGGFTYVNLTEIKRFLNFGNATESDWNNHERAQKDG